MMPDRKGAVLIFLALIYVPFWYSVSLFSGDGLPPAWVFISPTAGLVFWLWSLWDWGNQHFTTRNKALWLILLLTTLWIGSTLYFLAMGFKSRTIEAT